MFKTFKKIIKLRNATIRKNYWNRTYLSNPHLSLFVKVTDLIPDINAKQALIRCILNYIQNDNYTKLICECSTELALNSNGTLTEMFNVIKQSNDNNCSNNNNELLKDNLLLIAKQPFDKITKRQMVLQLIESVRQQIKHLKKEGTKYNGNFIYNFMVIQRSTNQLIPKCKLYTVFPNVNFQLKAIKNLSLSSKVDLNTLLISRHNKSILNSKGEQLINGFVTMSNEKRIITLIDDTAFDLKASKSLKQIIFGIWISIKNEDLSLYNNDIDLLIQNKKYLIFRKCLDFLMISNKIETIYSPSPDEGMFLLILFLQGVQRFYEVKVLPNEEGKTIMDENNEMFVNNDFDMKLEKFSNQWLVMKRKFNIKDSQINTIEIDNNNVNILSSVDFINKLQGNTNTISKSTSLKKSGNSTNIGMNNVIGKSSINYYGNSNSNINVNTNSNMNMNSNVNMNMNSNINVNMNSNLNVNMNSNMNSYLKNNGSTNTRQIPLFDSLNEMFEEPSNDFFNNIKIHRKRSFELKNEQNSKEIQIPVSNLKGSYCQTSFNRKSRDQSTQTQLTFEDIAMLNNSNLSNQNSQCQALNNTIKEQSLSVQKLQQRVNDLTIMLQQVTTLLNEREKNCICKKHKHNNEQQSSLQKTNMIPISPNQISTNNNNNLLLESQGILSNSENNDKLKLRKSNTFSSHSKVDNKDFDNEYLINKNIPDLSDESDSNKNDNSNNSSLLNLSQSNNSGEKSINIPTIKYNPETSNSFI